MAWLADARRLAICMTTIIVWLLISEGMAWSQITRPTVTVAQFASQADCEDLRKKIDVTGLKCFEAKVLKP